MPSGAASAVGSKNTFYQSKTTAGKLSTADCCRISCGCGNNMAQIYPAGMLIIRMKHHIQKAAPARMPGPPEDR